MIGGTVGQRPTGTTPLQVFHNLSFAFHHCLFLWLIFFKFIVAQVFHLLTMKFVGKTNEKSQKSRKHFGHHRKHTQFSQNTAKSVCVAGTRPEMPLVCQLTDCGCCGKKLRKCCPMARNERSDWPRKRRRAIASNPLCVVFPLDPTTFD